MELLDDTLLRFIPDAPRSLVSLLVEFERETRQRRRASVVGDAVRGLKHSARARRDRRGSRRGSNSSGSCGGSRRPRCARLPAHRSALSRSIEDGCVPLDALGRLRRGLRDARTRHGIPVAIFGHAGDGHVHVNALPDITRPAWREALRAALR